MAGGGDHGPYKPRLAEAIFGSGISRRVLPANCDDVRALTGKPGAAQESSWHCHNLPNKLSLLLVSPYSINLDTCCLFNSFDCLLYALLALPNR